MLGIQFFIILEKDITLILICCQSNMSMNVSTNVWLLKVICISFFLFFTSTSSVALCVSGCKSRTFFLITKTFWNFFLRKFSSRFDQSLCKELPQLRGAKITALYLKIQIFFYLFSKIFYPICLSLYKEHRSDCGCKTSTLIRNS